MQFNMSEFDCIFLSYNEPNANANWANLQQLAPWAMRVHGVKGFDAAHKACAKKSTTDRFITVDGDNIVDPSFFDLTIDIPDDQVDCVYSWGGYNIINGLSYGNGGLKLWTREFVLNMRSHEHVDESTAGWNVDFCWSPKYIQMANVYSTTCPNGSAQQAFKAGYREGVKMALDRGNRPDVSIPLKNQIHWKNYQRLLVWLMVGTDVANGAWACLGARMGLLYTLTSDGSLTVVNDLDLMDELFESVANIDPIIEANSLTSKLQSFGLEVGDLLAPQECIFYKASVKTPNVNFNPLTKEY